MYDIVAQMMGQRNKKCKVYKALTLHTQKNAIFEGRM